MKTTELNSHLHKEYNPSEIFRDADYIDKLLKGEKEMSVEELTKESIRLSNSFTERTYLINNNYLEEIEIKLKDLKTKKEEINKSTAMLETIKKNIIADQQTIIKHLINRINGSNKISENKKLREILENIEKEENPQEFQVDGKQNTDKPITI